MLAAEVYEVAENWPQAGWDFHYAAHGFRELGEYWKAGWYYRKSAKCFKNVKLYEHEAIRAYKRGMASYYQVGEYRKAEGLRRRIQKVTSSEKKRT